MCLNNFANDALAGFAREITDLFFQYIENDRTLMARYLRLIGRDRGLDDVNEALGCAVREYFRLENLSRVRRPKSKLISSYRQHGRSRIVINWPRSSRRRRSIV